MKRLGMLALAALLGLGTASAAWAAHHEAGENAGGNAEEKRSDSADESSNAQWQDDATRGQERAEERKRAQEAEGEGKQKHERHEKRDRMEKHEGRGAHGGGAKGKK